MEKLPNEVKPRERFIEYGANSLSDYELLSIILRTGYKNKSVLDLAKEVIIRLRNIGNLNETTIEELTEIKGIGKTKAIEILTSIEFGKRVCKYQSKNLVIKSNKDLYDYIRYDLENLKYEEIRAYYLNVKGRIIDYKILGHGTINSSICDEKEIIKWAIKLSSNNIILVHNHPSGDSKPSGNDIIYTKKLIEYCKKMDFNLIEHLIIGKNNYFGIIQSYFK